MQMKAVNYEQEYKQEENKLEKSRGTTPMTTIWASYGFALADSAEPLLKYTWGIRTITTQKDGEKDIYTTQKDGEKNQKVISIKSYLTVIYRVIKWIPVMLLQKKQQEEEERHSRLCTSTISCPLLLDPVRVSH